MASNEIGAERYGLLPAHLVIDAMRDNGYRNAAHALAELMDNSIQAGATTVELLCEETKQRVAANRVNRINRIGVLDDGSGMDSSTLRSALQFGNGTRLDDRSGIGRFGMGLPTASISQCSRVDVWSWESPSGPFWHAYIDLDEIRSGTMQEVPEPKESRIPNEWKEASSKIGESGTLVVWSELDRCMWVTAQTIIDRSEEIMGRIYRRFIDRKDVVIRLVGLERSSHGVRTIEREARINDPMYLTVPSSTPAPYDNEPMFERDGDHWEVKFWFSAEDGEMHPVTVRFSLAKDKVRERPNAGSSKPGKHARANMGISIVRADRELELSQALVSGYDPRDRWWGVEIDFPPSLDRMFGVTNDKQSARYFGDVASSIEAVLEKDEKSVAKIKEEIEIEGDPSEPLIEVVHYIKRRLNNIHERVKAQAKNQRSSRQRHDTSAERQGTDVTNQRKDQGHHGRSDAGEDLPWKERQAALKQEYKETGLSDRQAQDMSERVIENGFKYTFIEGQLDGSSFFTVKPVAGEIVIKINLEHPAYEKLIEVLNNDIGRDDDREKLVKRLQQAKEGLKLLLIAWARFEDEETVPQRREEVQNVRTDWGRVASRFLRGE